MNNSRNKQRTRKEEGRKKQQSRTTATGSSTIQAACLLLLALTLLTYTSSTSLFIHANAATNAAYSSSSLLSNGSSGGNSSVPVVPPSFGLASVTLRGGINYPIVTGTVQFTQAGGPGSPVSIVANITGLAPGQYAMSIHEWGDVSSGRNENENGGDIDMAVTGEHFNVGSPTVKHGCYPSRERHTGDLGNITISRFDSFNVFRCVRDLIDLFPSRNSSIIGRTLILYRDVDDCSSSGGAGVPVAQGVVGLIDPTRYGYSSSPSSGGVVNEAGINVPWMGNAPPAGDKEVTAVAVLELTELGFMLDALSGIVYFSQLYYLNHSTGEYESKLRIIANITGLSPYSSHALHLHAWGDDSSSDGMSAGGHWNPFGTLHGFPSQGPRGRHLGDLGNVLADARGEVSTEWNVDAMSIVGDVSILGRCLILHSLPDTGDQPSGGSGNHLAIGVVGLSKRILPPAPQDGWFAAATMRGDIFHPEIFARFTFSQPQGPGIGFYSPVTIVGTFFGLRPPEEGEAQTSYALHIHSYGDVTSGIDDEGGEGISLDIVGKHFNPLDQPHGCPPNINRHAGDIGNVIVTGKDSFTQTFITPLIDLSDTIKSVIGRSLVLHNSTDRCDQPTGHAGVPIAQGVIGIVASPEAGFTNLANNIAVNQTSSLIARMMPTMEGQGVTGTVQTFLYPDKKFRLVANIRGVDPFSAHGLHLHTYGVDDPYVSSTSSGDHYNPLNMPHDLPNPISNARHLGDMGVVTSDADGHIKADILLDFTSPAFHLVHTLRGRGVVLHSLADSGEQPNGNSGGVGGNSMLSVGVLGLSGQSMPPDPTVYASFCDRYAKVLGMNSTFFISSALHRALVGVSAARTGMRYPDGFGAPAMHEVQGCMSEESPIKPWFNGEVGYRTMDSPPPLAPPSPDFTQTDSLAFLNLLDHLTQYFALMLGCSDYSSADYQGVQNMAVVHAGMFLDQSAMNYFQSAIRSAFTSFGCDELAVASILTPLFARFQRGSTGGSSASSICTEPSCRCAPNLCGDHCTPSACGTAQLKVNGSVPTWPTGYDVPLEPEGVASADSRKPNRATLVTIGCVAIAIITRLF